MLWSAIMNGTSAPSNKPKPIPMAPSRIGLRFAICCRLRGVLGTISYMSRIDGSELVIPLAFS
jgi:hypothetical protein